MSNYTPGNGAIWGQAVSAEIPTQFGSSLAGLAAAKAALPGGGAIQMPELGVALGAGWGSIGLIRFDSSGKLYLSRFHMADGSDPTKCLFWDLSALATATVRTITAHDWSGHLLAPATQGVSGQFLQSQGAAQPIWASAGVNALLDGTNHSDTLAGGVTRGDLIVGNSTPKWARFAIGSANTVLLSNGSDPAWTAVATLTALLEHQNLLHLKPFQVSGNVTINNGSFVLTDASGTNRFANVRVGDRINLDSANYPSSLYGFRATTSGATDANNITMDRSNASGGNITGATATVFPGSEHFDNTLLEGLISSGGWGTFDGGAAGGGTYPTMRGSYSFEGYASGATPIFQFLGSSSTVTPWGFAIRKNGTNFRAFFYATDLTADRVYKLPNLSGFTIVLNDGAQNIATKTFQSGNIFEMEATVGAGNGCSMRDPTDTTKTLRLDLTTIGTGTNRIQKVPPYDGTQVLDAAVTTISGATPSISGGRVFKVTNGGVTNMTDLTNSVDGKEVTLLFTNGNTTIKDTSTTGSFENPGSADITPAANEVWKFVRVNADSKWYCVSRSIN